MADNEITWESKGADKVARDARDVAKAQDQVEDSTRNAAKAADEGAGSWERVAKAAVVAKLAYEAVNEVVGDSVQIYADVNAVQGQIVRDLRQMGADGPRAAQAMREINSGFRENVRFGVKVSEQTKTFRDLLDITKDRAKAETDLALAIDINADKSTGLEKAGELVRKGRQGDVAILEELGVLTKQQAADLGALSDAGERTAIVMDILRDEFAGAAEENLGLADQLAANEAQYERLQLAIGKVVSELGAEGVGFIGGTLDAVTASNDGTFSINNLATAFENFADTIPTATENIGYFLDELELRDLPGLAANLGVLTEEGRAGIRQIAGRGRANTQQGNAAARFISSARERGLAARDAEGREGDGFVGPQLDHETRIRIAKEAQEAEQAAERERLEALKAREQAEAEAERERERRHQRQMDRLLEAGNAERKAAEDARLEAEKTREAEAQAASARRSEIERWKGEQDKFVQGQRKNEALVAKSRKEAALDSINAASMVGDAALEGAGMFLQGENAKNIKAGLGETAKAAAAIATGVTTGNPMQFVGAGLHVLAAGKYFAAAGQNTGVAPKGGGGGGGGAGGGSAPSVPSVPSASTRENADLVGEQGPAAGSRGAVYVYQSLWPPTAQQVRDTRRYIEADARRDV